MSATPSKRLARILARGYLRYAAKQKEREIPLACIGDDEASCHQTVNGQRTERR